MPNRQTLLADLYSLGMMTFETAHRLAWETLEEHAAREYAERLAAEQAEGLNFVSGLLDDLCDRWGLDPDWTWRYPRAIEAGEIFFPIRWVCGLNGDPSAHG